MTEGEAKTKMCCGPPSVAASNYYRAGADCDAPMHCLGSACMAWRWVVAPAPERFDERETSAPLDGQPAPPGGDGWTAVGSGRDEPEEGFPGGVWINWRRTASPATPGTGCCGLAGAPQ